MGAAQADRSQGNPGEPPLPLARSLAAPRRGWSAEALGCFAGSWVSASLCLLSLLEASFFPRTREAREQAPPLLGALKASFDESQPREILSGVSTLPWASGSLSGTWVATPTQPHLEPPRKAAEGEPWSPVCTPLDILLERPEQVGVGDAEWKSCPQLIPSLLGPRSWRKGRPSPLLALTPVEMRSACSCERQGGPQPRQPAVVGKECQK